VPVRVPPVFGCTTYAIVAPAVPVLGDIFVIHGTLLEASQVPVHTAVRVSTVLNEPPAAGTVFEAGASV
jgi:hypothetical protein